MAPQPSSSAAILEYMVWLIWTCLSETYPKLKNPVYDMVLTTSLVLS